MLWGNARRTTTATSIPAPTASTRGPPRSRPTTSTSTPAARATCSATTSSARSVSSAASNNGKPVFVGIARTADVDRYLRGTAHTSVTDVDTSPFNARATARVPPPSARPVRPTQSFWAASARGTGRSTLTWDVRDGDWSVVVMNADASRRRRRRRQRRRRACPGSTRPAGSRSAAARLIALVPPASCRSRATARRAARAASPAAVAPAAPAPPGRRPRHRLGTAPRPRRFPGSSPAGSRGVTDPPRCTPHDPPTTAPSPPASSSSRTTARSATSCASRSRRAAGRCRSPRTPSTASPARRDPARRGRDRRGPARHGGRARSAGACASPATTCRS